MNYRLILITLLLVCLVETKKKEEVAFVLESSPQTNQTLPISQQQPKTSSEKNTSIVDTQVQKEVAKKQGKKGNKAQRKEEKKQKKAKKHGSKKSNNTEQIANQGLVPDPILVSQNTPLVTHSKDSKATLAHPPIKIEKNENVTVMKIEQQKKEKQVAKVPVKATSSEIAPILVKEKQEIKETSQSKRQNIPKQGKDTTLAKVQPVVTTDKDSPKPLQTMQPPKPAQQQNTTLAKEQTNITALEQTNQTQAPTLATNTSQKAVSSTVQDKVVEQNVTSIQHESVIETNNTVIQQKPAQEQEEPVLTNTTTNKEEKGIPQKTIDTSKTDNSSKQIEENQQTQEESVEEQTQTETKESQANIINNITDSTISKESEVKQVLNVPVTINDTQANETEIDTQDEVQQATAPKLQIIPKEIVNKTVLQKQQMKNISNKVTATSMPVKTEAQVVQLKNAQIHDTTVTKQKEAVKTQQKKEVKPDQKNTTTKQTLETPKPKLVAIAQKDTTQTKKEQVKVPEKTIKNETVEVINVVANLQEKEEEKSEEVIELEKAKPKDLKRSDIEAIKGKTFTLPAKEFTKPKPQPPKKAPKKQQPKSATLDENAEVTVFKEEKPVPNVKPKPTKPTFESKPKEKHQAKAEEIKPMKSKVYEQKKETASLNKQEDKVSQIHIATQQSDNNTYIILGVAIFLILFIAIRSCKPPAAPVTASPSDHAINAEDEDFSLAGPEIAERLQD